MLAGDPEQALPTVGFSASQHDIGGFVFGGVNGSGGYTNGLWFTDLPDRMNPEGGALVVQRLAGDIGLTPGGSQQSAALATGSSSTSGSGSGSSSKTSSGGTTTSSSSRDLFVAFMRSHPPKYKRKRLDLLVRQALKRWQSRQAKASGGSVTTASSPTPPSFSATSPPGQAESIAAYSPDWATVSVLYGDTGSSPASGSLVSLAIYDLVAGSWVSGTVDWSATAGNRRYVAYAGRSGQEIVFYGGEADGEVADGLYLLDLNPELLMAGVEPVRIDDSSASSPGPRSRARIVFDPYAEGGAGAVYLFGGIDSSATVQNDLWRYSLLDGQWTLLAASQSDPNAPPAMLGGGLLVRAPDGGLVVYSGSAAGGSAQQAAYLFVEGQGWQVLAWPDA